MRKFEHVLTALAVIVALDLVIVIMAIMQIANGVETPHIPFWDKQIEIVVSIIK